MSKIINYNQYNVKDNKHNIKVIYNIIFSMKYNKYKVSLSDVPDHGYKLDLYLSSLFAHYT